MFIQKQFCQRQNWVKGGLLYLWGLVLSCPCLLLGYSSRRAWLFIRTFLFGALWTPFSPALVLVKLVASQPLHWNFFRIHDCLKQRSRSTIGFNTFGSHPYFILKKLTALLVSHCLQRRHFNFFPRFCGCSLQINYKQHKSHYMKETNDYL